MAVIHGRGSLVKLVDTIPERPDSVYNFLIEIYLIDNIMYVSGILCSDLTFAHIMK